MVQCPANTHKQFLALVERRHRDSCLRDALRTGISRHQTSGRHATPKRLSAYASSNWQCNRASCDVSEICIDEWKMRRGIQGICFHRSDKVGESTCTSWSLVNLTTSLYQLALPFSHNHFHSDTEPREYSFCWDRRKSTPKSACAAEDFPKAESQAK